MTTNQFKTKMVRCGIYYKVTWKSEVQINGVEYTKISNGVVRFLGKTQECVKTNKQGVDYVRLFLTNNSHHKASVRYFVNGVETTKTDFESQVPSNNYNITTCFSKHINDIISIG